MVPQRNEDQKLKMTQDNLREENQYYKEDPDDNRHEIQISAFEGPGAKSSLIKLPKFDAEEEEEIILRN